MPADVVNGKKMNWVLEALKKYAVFSGRARRREYWWFALFYFVGTFLLTIVDVVIGRLDEKLGVGVFSGIFLFAFLLPSLSVTVRRLHDINLSGWWILIGLFPIFGVIVVLIFAVLRGNLGENKYGSDPRNIAA